MHINLRRGIDRLFAVLVVVWVIFCLIVYPVWQRQLALTKYNAEVRNCYMNDLGKGQGVFDACLKYAEVMSDLDLWTLKAYYARESWLLAIVVVVTPILAYGLLRGLVAVGEWVWRGFLPTT